MLRIVFVFFLNARANVLSLMAIIHIHIYVCIYLKIESVKHKPHLTTTNKRCANFLFKPTQKCEENTLPL